MHIISLQGISEYIQNALTADIPLYTYDWTVALYHKSGGIKKTWYIGASECPITRMDFELHNKLCGAGSIALGYMDIPIDADDFILLYYKGSLVYRALVDNTIDPKGGMIELMPYSVKYSENLYNGSFTSKTVDEIMQTIIQSVQSDTGIEYNTNYMNTGSTDTHTIEYEYEPIDKIFKKLMERLDDREWGVDANNILHVYTDETSINQYMYQIDKPYFSNMEAEKNYGDVNSTRLQVYKKSATAGQVARVGQVGYDAAGGSYPILAIENIVRKKIGKITVNEKLSDAEALDYAYAKLQADTATPLTIDISDLRYDLYFPTIGHLLLVQDTEEQILRTIIDCESTTDWSGDITVSLDTDDYVYAKDDGSTPASITFEAVSAVSNVKYDFGELKRWNNATRISFMLKADYAGDYLELFAFSGESQTIDSMTNTIDSYTEYIDEIGSADSIKIPFTISTGGVWCHYDFELTIDTFRYFGLRVVENPPATSTIKLDRVQIYCTHRTEYEANIKMAKFSLEPNNQKCDLVLSKIDTGANDNLFALDEKIKQLEAVNQQ